MEKFGNKINLSGCKWSNLNTLGTETPVSHSLLSDSLFPYFQPLLPPSVLPLFGVIRNWTSHFPSMKGRKVDNFWNKFRLTGCKWSNLNAPGTETPVSHPIFGDSLFPFSAPAPSFPPLSGVIRNWTSQYERQKGGKCLEQNQVIRLQLVQFECPRVTHPLKSSTFGIKYREFLFPSREPRFPSRSSRPMLKLP